MAKGYKLPPQQVTLTDQETNALKDRIKKNDLTDGDVKIL